MSLGLAFRIAGAETVAFFACFAPIWMCAAAANAEYTPTPQVFAVLLGQFVAAIGFFVFLFFPGVILVGWPWISRLLNLS
jgi:hypothetical protein